MLLSTSLKRGFEEVEAPFPMTPPTYKLPQIKTNIYIFYNMKYQLSPVEIYLKK